MRRNIFYALFALSLMAGGTVTAAENTPVVKMMSQGDNVPQCVRDFLQTPVGKSYSLTQVMNAYNNSNIVSRAEGADIVSETKVDEDFSLWTKGSEDAPDGTAVENADALTKTPGWTAFLTYQAGGKAYLGYDEVGDDGPGYFMTPDLDLSEGEGIFKVTFRVKNVNPDVQDQGLQYFILNNDPQNKGMISATSLPMTTEWSDLSFITHGGVKYTSVMFLGWKGKVLVDNVKIEKLTYPLSSPKNVSFSVTGGGEITAKWDAVEGVESYLVELLDKDAEDKASFDGEVVATVNTASTSAVLQCAINATHRYEVRVTAVSGDKKSYPGAAYDELEVAKVDAPVAKEASEVTTSGFTANWEASQYAANYKVSFIRTHTATADGEEITYIDDDFDTIPYDLENPKSTIQTTDFVTPVSLDDIFAIPGWSTMLGVGITGYFGITNMYETYGLPGALFGPEADFSIGEGKARISGIAASSVDDVQVKVGFGTYKKGQVAFNDGAQVFETSTKGSAFDVEVSGGSKDSRLIFQIIDAAEGGDFVLFDNIKATATLKKGDTFTLPYSVVTLPYDATSYKLDVPFTGNDSFQYWITGSFGSVVSGKSEVITVKSPEFNGVSSVKADAAKAAEYYTLDGMRVADPVKSGVYLMKTGDKTVKVMK